MYDVNKLFLTSLYILHFTASTGECQALLFVRNENDVLSLEITPTKNNLVETLTTFGKEYKVSLEFKADSVGANYDNVIQIGNRHVGIWMDPNSEVYVEALVSGAAKNTIISDFTLGTFHKIEISQSLIVDKVLELYLSKERLQSGVQMNV